jgi:hypothetical protein
MAGLDQIRGHGVPHNSQTEESDSHVAVHLAEDAELRLDMRGAMEVKPIATSVVFLRGFERRFHSQKTRTLTLPSLSWASTVAAAFLMLAAFVCSS